MNPELLNLHRQYANGIIHCDEFAESIKGMKGLHPQYEPIVLILEWYRNECRSITFNFDHFGWDSNQVNTMAGYYARLKDAVDNVVYPNVVEGTNL